MYDALLVTHFLGLALGVGTSFAMLRLGKSAQDLEPAERTSFMLRAMAVSKNGSVGVVLLLVSGIAMVAVRGVHESMVAGGPPFHVKLTLVLVLIGLLGYSQVLGKRVREAKGGPDMAKLPKLGMGMLLTGVSIVVLAVLAFH